MKGKGLHIISVIISVDDYRDRFTMLHGLKDGVTKHIIFTKKLSPLFADDDIVTVRAPQQNMNAVDFWNWCVQEASAIIQNSSEDWICVQYVAGSVCRDLKKKFGKKVHCGVFLASAENNYLKQKYWNIDPYAVKADWKQKFSYIKQSWKKKYIQKLSTKGCDFILGNSSLAVDDVKCSNSVVKKVLNGNAIVGDISPLVQKHSPLKFLYVGNIQPPKGIGTLLKAFHDLNLDNVELTLVGKVLSRDKMWFDTLQRKYPVKGLKLVDFLPQEKLAEFYKQNNIFVFPSFLEGSPRVVVEALKYGTLIVAKDIPGNRSVDPKGLFIQYYNSLEELCTLLAENALHYQEKQQTLASARESVIEPLRVDNYRKNLIRFFEEVRDGKSSN